MFKIHVENEAYEAVRKIKVLKNLNFDLTKSDVFERMDISGAQFSATDIVVASGMISSS